MVSVAKRSSKAREAKGSSSNEPLRAAASIPSRRTARAVREISRSRSLWTTWKANGSHAGKARLGGLRFA